MRHATRSIQLVLFIFYFASYVARDTSRDMSSTTNTTLQQTRKQDLPPIQLNLQPQKRPDPPSTPAQDREEINKAKFPVLVAYIQFAIILVFGNLRDFFGKLSGKSRYLATRPRKGYADMFVSWENFYTRRVYHRVQDVFNRPVAGPPAATIDLYERLSDDGNKSLYIDENRPTKSCVNLGSYNYLGFADDWMNTCSAQVLPYINKLPAATTTAPMTFGTTTLHRQLEKTVAEFVGKEDAIVYNMGYGTNSTTIPALMGKGSLIVSDSLNHASIVNGARVSAASVKVFRHNDAAHLEEVLRNAIAYGQPRTHRPWKKILVMVEGIYSMEGKIADLPQILAVTKKYKAYIYVDEAHSIGALGKTGRGICEYHNVNPDDIDILMGTFSKSFAGMGGYISGSKDLIDQIRRSSIGSIYAPSLSPLVTAQILAAFRVIKGEDGTDLGQQKIESLRSNSNYFRKGLEKMGLQILGDEDSPVIPVLLYTISKICSFSRACLEKNLAVVTVGFPATPLLLSRVRFCLSAAHTREHLDQALMEIEEIAKTQHIRFMTHRLG